MTRTLSLCGFRPPDIFIMLAIAAIQFEPPVDKQQGRRAAEIVGATERSIEEFEAGRENG